jgi:hypothetical protein
VFHGTIADEHILHLRGLQKAPKEEKNQSWTAFFKCLRYFHPFVRRVIVVMGQKEMAMGEHTHDKEEARRNGGIHI